MNTRHKTKRLDYAYPTSPLAEELNQPSGAWLITVGFQDQYLHQRKVVGYYDDKFEALAVFQRTHGEIESGSFTIQFDVFNPTTEG